MIRRLEVTNYQAHEHSVIDLGPWTTLTGGSDRGKSAMLRALYALITNQRGDGFIRHGAAHCEVGVLLDDGWLTWHKARGRSGTYTWQGETYERTGSEIPEAVRAALPMAIAVAGESIMPGFQRQFDAPFLLADTARRRAQVLGEFDGTNTLLMADGLVRRGQAQAQRVVKASDETLATLRRDREALAWLDEAVPLLAQAEEAERQAEQQARLVAELEALVAEEREIAERLARAKAALEAFAPLREAEELLVEVGLLEIEIAELEGLVAELEQIERARAAVRQIERPDFAALHAELVELEGLARVAQEAEVAEGQLVLAREQLAQAAQERRLAEAELLAHVGEACPVCGQVLSREALGV